MFQFQVTVSAVWGGVRALGLLNFGPPSENQAYRTPAARSRSVASIASAMHPARRCASCCTARKRIQPHWSGLVPSNLSTALLLRSVPLRMHPHLPLLIYCSLSTSPPPPCTPTSPSRTHRSCSHCTVGRLFWLGGRRDRVAAHRGLPPTVVDLAHVAHRPRARRPGGAGRDGCDGPAHHGRHRQGTMTSTSI